LRIRITISLILFVGYNSISFAQLIEKPLPPKLSKIRTIPVFGAEGGGATAPTTVLPFWDEFSTSNNFPDDQKWHESQNVRIASNIGIDAPSLHVAVFDGVDATGAGYNPSSVINGLADCMTSAIIDLSVLDASQADSVFMSFFWQLKGKGELANEEDSIVLQFLDEGLNWNTVWSKSGGLENETQEFQQEILKIPFSIFHDEFQFRFQSYGKLSGPFDTWLIDYVYINYGRHGGDNAYLDRALTTPGNFLTAPYTALPTEQFFADPSKYLVDLSVEFYNLNSFFQPILYSASVKDLVTDQDVQVLSDEIVAIPGGFERDIFTSPALDANNLDPDADSLWLEATVYIKSGDIFFIEEIDNNNDTTFNFQIDYRLNDTVRNVTVIDDYLAYDDGEPDFAAGINQRGGRLAYRYVLEEKALLTHIDINFPLVQQTGFPIEVVVWKSIGEEKDSVQYQNSYSVQRSSEIGELKAYALDTPIFVQDTIYIGFVQATDEFLAVGLDKNTDSGDHMFYNVDGNWRDNEYVQGSFLMRPRFDKTIAADFIPNNPGAANLDPNIYPNPSGGTFVINGVFEDIFIVNSWGQQKHFRKEEQDGKTILDLSENESGIYLIKLSQGNKTTTKRIIINN
jgi:Secretion system C-terminal sorting domain